MEEDLRPFKAENFGGWTQTTTEPIEVATVDGMKPYEGYTIEVNN